MRRRVLALVLLLLLGGCATTAPDVNVTIPDVRGSDDLTLSHGNGSALATLGQGLADLLEDLFE